MMKAVKFRGDIEVAEVPLPPIPQGHVLVKVKLASVGPLERGLLRGLLWVEPERTLGMEGYGTVEELGVGVEEGEYEGREVLVNSFHANKILGVHSDGALAEYLVVPADAVREVTEDLPDYAKALASAGALALSVVDKVADKKTLLVGAGLTNLLISFSLSWEAPLLPWGREPAVDVNYYPTTASACTQEWDAVVVSVPEASAVDTAAMCVREGGTVVLHPLVDYSKHVFSGKKVDVVVPEPGDLLEGAKLVARMPLKYLREVVEEVESFGEALNSSLSRSLVRPEALEVERPS